MKTSAELAFDSIVTDIFHKTLKPRGYKKKGNNFYIQNNGIGKIINLQKSKYNSKEYISFTINTGIFSPEYWNNYYNYSNKGIPDYPTEPECILRRRIGELLGTKDTWYEISADSDIDELKAIQFYNLSRVILPYFDKINSNDDILIELDKGRIAPTLKLFFLCVLNRFAEAQIEYNRLHNETTNQTTLRYLIDLSKKYNLVQGS
ncbi:DUF4304 domain-containing protein [uncultured Mucilaginibacter sp.]|uniref:DUF4304 domain-containing protein n=1 Tax=uncultured Mucilaginibacter sp. TaxID=797541 RepID=UPI0025CECFBA|nr:DUF4304 domain-containing protein [uncultured Mucilaginibacter sp.]